MVEAEEEAGSKCRTQDSTRNSWACINPL